MEILKRVLFHLCTKNYKNFGRMYESVHISYFRIQYKDIEDGKKTVKTRKKYICSFDGNFMRKYDFTIFFNLVS